MATAAVASRLWNSGSRPSAPAKRTNPSSLTMFWSTHAVGTATAVRSKARITPNAETKVRKVILGARGQCHHPRSVHMAEKMSEASLKLWIELEGRLALTTAPLSEDYDNAATNTATEPGTDYPCPLNPRRNPRCRGPPRRPARTTPGPCSYSPASSRLTSSGRPLHGLRVRSLS
ncbi:hypothetical protein ARTHRO9V_90540 [Arthrobacter sp. 9V]|nr:hypothetical protein ARTHRO9V_90540 [Arthrobacter sp. 9V]